MATTPRTPRPCGGYWTCSYYDDTGRRHCRRFGNVKRVDKAEALRKFRAWLVTWAAGKAAAGRDPTVAELAAAFDQHAQTFYRKHDRATGEADLIGRAMGRVVKMFGRLPVNSVTVKNLSAVRQAMVDAGLARTTVNKYVDKIRLVFKWGVQHRGVKPETWYGLKSLSSLRAKRGVREAEPVKAPEPEAIEKVVALLAPVPKAMAQVQLLTAMRPGEVCLMRACDIDVTDPSCWVYTPSEFKTEHYGKARTIYIGRRAQAILRPFLARPVDAYLFCPREAPRTRRAIGGRTVGDRYSTSSYGHAVRRACRRAGVPLWSPNALRHRAATDIRAEHGIEAAQRILGHSRLKTTEVYAETNQAQARQLMREVG